MPTGYKSAHCASGAQVIDGDLPPELAKSAGLLNQLALQLRRDGLPPAADQVVHHPLGQRELEALPLALHAPLHSGVCRGQRRVGLPPLDVLQQGLADIEKRPLHLLLHLLERQVLLTLRVLLLVLALRLVSAFR
eukprot:scaffold26255_cov59-Phaeocystis_antarctica.AAC.4